MRYKVIQTFETLGGEMAVQCLAWETATGVESRKIGEIAAWVARQPVPEKLSKVGTAEECAAWAEAERIAGVERNEVGDLVRQCWYGRKAGEFIARKAVCITRDDYP